MPDTDQQELGRRVRIAREHAKLSQEALSDRIGFKDRQTLSAIESGIRKVSADELMLILEATGLDLDFFTDRYRLVGEGAWSFRAERAEPGMLDAFEARAGTWIAGYRRIGNPESGGRSVLRTGLALDTNSSFEDAQAAGDALAREWELGEVPAKLVRQKAEERLGLLVLFVDAPAGVSGAACQLTALDTVLINRNDPPGRRNFDFCHELFHVMTWDRMPPERVDVTTPRGHKAKRIERLANNFAGALLMPSFLLRRFWDKYEAVEANEWFELVARHFRVSCEALRYRLRALGWMSEADEMDVDWDRLKNLYGDESLPPLYSKPFLERFHAAIEKGNVSLRKACSILETDPEGLGELFTAWGLEGLDRLG